MVIGLLLIVWCVLLSVVGGCSIRVDAEWSIMDKWSRRIQIEKTTRTTVPVREDGTIPAETEEIKSVNPQTEGGDTE